MELDAWNMAIGVMKLLVYIFSFLALGQAMFMYLFNKSGEATIIHANELTAHFAILAILASIAHLLAQTGLLADDGLMGMFDIEMLGIIFETSVWSSFVLRVVGLTILFFGVKYYKSFQKVKIASIAVVILSFAWVGHSSGNYAYITMALLMAHLLVVGFWFGALIPLYKVTNSADGIYILERFGYYASFAVPVLIVAGLVLAYLILGDLSLLFTSTYGWFLLRKLALVGLLLVLALVNKTILVPSLKLGGVAAIFRLRRVIKFEFILFLVILAVTATLTSAVRLPH